jgi:hypothetical protein
MMDIVEHEEIRVLQAVIAETEAAVAQCEADLATAAHEVARHMGRLRQGEDAGHDLRAAAATQADSERDLDAVQTLLDMLRQDLAAEQAYLAGLAANTN